MILFLVVLDVLYCIADGTDLLCLVVRNGYVELLLELHDQFHGVQGVCAKVVGETCFRLNLFFINTELVNDNIPYFNSISDIILIF